MPKKTPIRVRPIKHRRYEFLVAVPPQLHGGKRERKFFVSRKEAQGFADDLQVRKENFGTRLLQMAEPLRQEAMDCVKRLKPFQTSLSQAVTFFVQHQRNAQRSCTVADLIAKFIPAKKAAETSIKSASFPARALMTSAPPLSVPTSPTKSRAQETTTRFSPPPLVGRSLYFA